MDRRAFLTQAAGAAGAGLFLPTTSWAKAATDRQVHHILVDKGGRSLFLMNRSKQMLKRYPIALGSQPLGHKRRQGDGRTPEGLYAISGRIPNSRFHLSFGISYPNAADIRRARRSGVSPGGDICLHGTGMGDKRVVGDWTAGCIAVSDAHMDEIYRYVRPGMPIHIQA